jgi:excisionase family DNA binding protein
VSGFPPAGMTDPSGVRWPDRRIVRIAKADRITYDEAQHILGRGERWVQALVTSGQLGVTSVQHGARLSRREVEAMALRRWAREPHRRIRSDYWCTQAEAARLLGVTKQTVHAKLQRGQLPGLMTATGLYVFRRGDIEQIAEERRVNPPIRGKHTARQGATPDVSARRRKTYRRNRDTSGEASSQCRL